MAGKVPNGLVTITGCATTELWIADLRQHVFISSIQIGMKEEKYIGGKLK